MPRAPRPIELAPPVADALAAAAAFPGIVEGLTHDFYRYPARFSPTFAAASIEALSKPGDIVCDIFMGGGTTVVEALAAGRTAVGVDLNALAAFVAGAKTTPLTIADERALRSWAQTMADLVPHADLSWIESPRIKNLPPPVERALAVGLLGIEDLSPRQQSFARAALLRVGQWAMDGRETGSLRARVLAEAVPAKVDEMLRGLRRFVEECNRSGIGTEDIVDSRRLLNRSSIGIDAEEELKDVHGKIGLCVCSPPYPGVHVLYHRWQHRGRRETSAPYWVAAQQDGCGGSYYTMGSRTQSGAERYYDELRAAFASLRPLLRRDAHIVQLVAFTDRAEHLPRYLDAMTTAGYTELRNAVDSIGRIWRNVPNRRWYNRVRSNDASDSASEVVLIHTPARRA